jgi:hypothetical protein
MCRGCDMIDAHERNSEHTKHISNNRKRPINRGKGQEIYGGEIMKGGSIAGHWRRAHTEQIEHVCSREAGAGHHIKSNSCHHNPQ